MIHALMCVHSLYIMILADAPNKLIWNILLINAKTVKKIANYAQIQIIIVSNVKMDIY